MSPFEFFFSLFGLILGLAIAVVIGGLSDVLRQRERVKIGWLTPLLALFVLDDLSTCWVNAWNGLSGIQVAFGPFAAAVVVAGTYFFAASMVFPKTLAEWPSLDEYYMSRHRYVLGGVLVANIGIIAIEAAARNSWEAILRGFTQTEVTMLWWITMAVLILVSNKRVQLAGLGILLLIGLYTIIMFWAPR